MADAMLPLYIKKYSMDLVIASYCHLWDNKAIVNNRLVYYQENILMFADFIKFVYKQEAINYPKFYKMDSLSKLGFLAAELVFKASAIEGYRPETIGIVVSNSSASLDTDMAHCGTIDDRSSYFPSPSIFVYTLPNIVIGEICIKNKIKGENAFFITEKFDGKLMAGYISELFINKRVEACLCGWTELRGNTYNAMMALVKPSGHRNDADISGTAPLPFNAENLNLIMTHN